MDQSPSGQQRPFCETVSEGLPSGKLANLSQFHKSSSFAEKQIEDEVTSSTIESGQACKVGENHEGLRHHQKLNSEFFVERVHHSTSVASRLCSFWRRREYASANLRASPTVEHSGKCGIWKSLATENASWLTGMSAPWRSSNV